MEDDIVSRTKSNSNYFGMNREFAMSFNENLLENSNYKRRPMGDIQNESSSSFSVKMEESFEGA